MSKSVIISLLGRANNGNELLQILDSIASDNQQDVAYNEPTADVIEF